MGVVLSDATVSADCQLVAVCPIKAYCGPYWLVEPDGRESEVLRRRVQRLGYRVCEVGLAGWGHYNAVVVWRDEEGYDAYCLAQVRGLKGGG